eukprot:s1410_g6.t1
MNEALNSGAVDVIGLARPLCTEASGPRMLLQGELDTLRRHAPVIGIRYIDNSLGAALNNLWHGAHIHNLGKGLPVKPAKLNPSLWKMILLDMTFVYVWDPKRNLSKTRCILALFCFAVLAATGGILAAVLEEIQCEWLWDAGEPTALHGDTWHGAAQSIRYLGGRCWVERAKFLKRRKTSWTYSWYTLTLPFFLDEMQEADALLFQLGIAGKQALFPCVFFNDLPCLTPGAPKEILWRDVPKLCSEHCLMPRLLLYESRSAAEDACKSWQKLSSEEEQALDASSPSNPQWTRQSFLRRGSRRTRAETPSRPEGTAAVAEEAPALHGADRLRAEKDLRPDLKVSAESLRRLSGQEDAAGRVFGAPRPKQMPREAPTSQLLGVSAPLPAKAAAGGTPASASSAATSQVPLMAAASSASAPQTPRTATPAASPRLSAAQTRQGEAPGYPAASMSSASTVGSQQTLPKPPSLTLGSPAATPVSIQREPSISTSSAPSPRTAPASSSASPAKAAGLAIGSRGGGVRVGGGTPKQAASAASPF